MEKAGGGGKSNVQSYVFYQGIKHMKNASQYGRKSVGPRAERHRRISHSNAQRQRSFLQRSPAACCIGAPAAFPVPSSLRAPSWLLPLQATGARTRTPLALLHTSDGNACYMGARTQGPRKSRCDLRFPPTRHARSNVRKGNVAWSAVRARATPTCQSRCSL